MVTIQDTSRELQEVVLQYTEKINAIAESVLDVKPDPHRWSKKEILGHLIDSAQNNLRRFICGQYEAVPPRIRYEQEFWVTANGYAQQSKHDVLLLWKLTNEQICSVLNNMPPENYGKTCDTGKDSPNLHSLEWLAEDYLKHLKHHLTQIIPGAFNIVYV